MSFNITGPDSMRWVQVDIDWPNIGDTVIKAGTPMSQDGKIANDGNAYGVLMGDVERKRNRMAQLLVAGFMDFAAAEEHSGVQLTAEAKAAMPKLYTLCGCGGSSNLKVTLTYPKSTIQEFSHTGAEILAAWSAGGTVVCEVPQRGVYLAAVGPMYNGDAFQEFLFKEYIWSDANGLTEREYFVPADSKTVDVG